MIATESCRYKKTFELKKGIRHWLRSKGPVPFVLFLFFLLLPAALSPDQAPAPAAKKSKKLVIKDYRKRLNKKYKKEKRKSTRFIIVHTSEAGLSSTLRTLSKGKKVNGYRTIGGHANYAIARNGVVYRLLGHKYRADHAGLSMWGGTEDISSYSIGIELIGFHYADISNAQYTALGLLVSKLRKMYNIPGKNVLTHSQVSYGKPNRWNRRNHRGRKRCGLNFDRSRIGLGNDLWSYDPDVKAGRLKSDRRIYAVFYKPHRGRKITPTAGKVKPPPTIHTAPSPVKTAPPPPPAAAAAVAASNIISKDNTAWNIAGEDYNSSATLYLLPDQKEIRGDKIKTSIGWDRIPKGTRVLLNQSMDREAKKGPIYTITPEITAWSFAGKAYNAQTTFYFINGKIVPGNHVSDWDSLSKGTRMIVGYRLPQYIGAVQGETPWSIAGRAYNHGDTIYYIPGQLPVTGDKIKDFNDLPSGTRIFLKLK